MKVTFSEFVMKLRFTYVFLYKSKSYYEKYSISNLER